MSDHVFTKGVYGVRRTRRVREDLLADNDYSILKIESPEIVVDEQIETIPIAGTFISAQVSKLSGNKNITTVELKLDGKTVIKISFDKALKLGLSDKNNPYGIVLYKGDDVETLTIGFSTPLFFVKELEIIVHVKTQKVDKIEAVVVWGTKVSMGNEETPDDDDVTDFPG